MARKPRPTAKIPTEPVYPFDQIHGTDTGGLIPASALHVGHPNDRHITAYYGVAPSILDTLIDHWLESRPVFPIDRYTFLDIGAGKGRAMLVASLHPFHRVLGVELNPHLAAIARTNIAVFPASASPLAPVSLIEGDALAAELPDTPTVAFLFHPFEAPVLRRFLARVTQAFRDRPGHFDLLYVNAEHATVIDQHPGFTRVYAGTVPMSTDDHLADLAAIATQTEYGSTGDEICAIYRFTGGN
ncbi:class I SAM-dependent methyltransferase [Granulicella sp. WH15]|uniref:class I SAM-dependent methyltransferase n=1 Tax=Granulicella sp. WH15 TaxID=2602070 RepID=UPI0013670B07|nr:class I SAM-dependent methyltransferase [Granulicella sp. WH15]QHN04442.1 class I SAM-dependent methyltransferase [Granulicella sp. WH15]